MNLRCLAAVAALLTALAGCDRSGSDASAGDRAGGGLEGRWLGRPAVATTRDLDRLAFTVDVPKGLPAAAAAPEQAP